MFASMSSLGSPSPPPLSSSGICLILMVTLTSPAAEATGVPPLAYEERGLASSKSESSNMKYRVAFHCIAIAQTIQLHVH